MVVRLPARRFAALARQPQKDVLKILIMPKYHANVKMHPEYRFLDRPRCAASRMRCPIYQPEEKDP